MIRPRESSGESSEREVSPSGGERSRVRQDAETLCASAKRSIDIFLPKPGKNTTFLQIFDSAATPPGVRTRIVVDSPYETAGFPASVELRVDPPISERFMVIDDHIVLTGHAPRMATDPAPAAPTSRRPGPPTATGSCHGEPIGFRPGNGHGSTPRIDGRGSVPFLRVSSPAPRQLGQPPGRIVPEISANLRVWRKPSGPESFRNARNSSHGHPQETSGGNHPP